MVENEFVYVKARLEEELHKELKVIANSEKTLNGISIEWGS